MPPTLLLPPTANSSSSYGQILRSSSIIGGATGINYVIGMVRTKAVAVLLGPSGIGLEANGIYQAAWGLSGMLAGFILGAMGTDFYRIHAAIALARPVVLAQRKSNHLPVGTGQTTSACLGSTPNSLKGSSPS